MKEILEVIKDLPQERISKSIQVFQVPVRILEETVEVIESPVPLFQEGTVEVIQSIPQERVSERIVDHIVDAPDGAGCLGRVESEHKELQRLRWERVQEVQAELIS